MLEDKAIEISPAISLEVNSEEVHEIITAVPSWMLRRGITLIFLVLLTIVGGAAFIQYPDVVKTDLKVSSLNAPKSVYIKQTGKITALLVKEGAMVKQDALLAFMESTANHKDVFKLFDSLMRMELDLGLNNNLKSFDLSGLNLGELQNDYQNYYQQYLQYISTQQGGYYLDRKKYLERDLKEIEKLKIQINIQRGIQEKEFENLEQEFDAYKKLYQKGVISSSEYKQQESKYLAGKHPLQQNVTEMVNNTSSFTAKQKEILELEHTILEEKAKFSQSLNNMIAKTKGWINQYTLIAPVSGTVTYAGIVQESQSIDAGKEVFIINPANTDFFGEVQIPQYNMGKVKIGQRTLIKMRSFPFEQYGLIRGRIKYISDVAFRDSIFIAKVSFDEFENKGRDRKIVLKNGMAAQAEIITEESSLLKRLSRNMFRMLNSN
jgi:multidrug resistance efflux pump